MMTCMMQYSGKRGTAQNLADSSKLRKVTLESCPRWFC